MQIVIDIPEEIIENVKSGMWFGNNIISNAIENGTVLPKHGRLIDADAIPYIRGMSDVCLPPYVYEYAIKEMPTILETTKE